MLCWISVKAMRALHAFFAVLKRASCLESALANFRQLNDARASTSKNAASNKNFERFLGQKRIDFDNLTGFNRLNARAARIHANL